MEQLSNEQKFEIWVKQPIEYLRQSPIAGNCGYIILALGLPLYEAYLRYDPETKIFNEEPSIWKVISKKPELELPPGFRDWWTILRHGLAHQFSPKPGYHFHHSFPAIPRKNNDVWELDPWKFVDMVLDIYAKNPDLVENLGLIQAEVNDKPSGKTTWEPTNSGGTINYPL